MNQRIDQFQEESQKRANEHGKRGEWGVNQRINNEELGDYYSKNDKESQRSQRRSRRGQENRDQEDSLSGLTMKILSFHGK